MAKKRKVVEGDCLPEVSANATQGQLGEALVEVAMLQLNQLYERRSGLDFGVDGVIELTTDGQNQLASGRQLGVQVKRGISNAVRTKFGFTHYCSEKHANYWINHSLPIIVVHSDPVSGQLRWRHVNPSSLRKTPSGYAIDLPPESELRDSLADLKALADHESTPAAPENQVLVLSCSMVDGLRKKDGDVGMAALEFARSALRGKRGRVSISIEEEADLIASIDAVRDISSPSAEERQKAVICEDILHAYRGRAARLERAIQLLLTSRPLAETFGYNDALLASAINWMVDPKPHPRNSGDVALEAWPSPGVYEPLIKFEVPQSAMDEIYARNDAERIYIRMGDAGENNVNSLSHEVAAVRFYPVLAQYLIAYADKQGLNDDEVLDQLEVPPTMWRMGLA